MNGLEISKELKNDIEANQNQLKNAIRNHQLCVLKVKEEPENIYLHKEVGKAEELIVFIGLEQKKLLERLRIEYKAYQKSVENNAIKNGIEDRRFNLSKALNRARKQNISFMHSNATNSYSDESGDEKLSPPLPSSTNSTPEHINPLRPQDLSQTKFLSYFRLATHEAYRDMQNRRAERKRRSTANPHFLYGGRGWDFLSQPKRKRGQFLARPRSPPTTRQAARRRQEARRTPPDSPDAENSNPFSNLPSGLIIERIGRSSPDARFCVGCKQPGALAVCENCGNGFHVSCHDKIIGEMRLCMYCVENERRAMGSFNMSSGINVPYASSKITEKLIEKKKLEEQKANLSAELTQLQNRHSELTISLKEQKNQQDELKVSHENAEKRIETILKFIETIKNAKLVENIDPDIKIDNDFKNDNETLNENNTECSLDENSENISQNEGIIDEKES